MIVLTAETTGGHLYPAIAVAQELNQETLFIVSKDKLGSQIVKKYGFSTTEIYGAKTALSAVGILFVHTMAVMGGFLALIKWAD